MDLPDDTPAGLLANVAPGDNSPALSVSELSALLDRSQSSVSQHLRVLRERNLVVASRQGRHVIHALSQDPVARIARELLDLVVQAARG